MLTTVFYRNKILRSSHRDSPTWTPGRNMPFIVYLKDDKKAEAHQQIRRHADINTPDPEVLDRLERWMQHAGIGRRVTDIEEVSAPGTRNRQLRKTLQRLASAGQIRIINTVTQTIARWFVSPVERVPQDSTFLRDALFFIYPKLYTSCVTICYNTIWPETQSKVILTKVRI